MSTVYHYRAPAMAASPPCNLCFPIYNTFPEEYAVNPTRDFPAHSRFVNPFKSPFVFAPYAPENFAHVFVPTDNVCGSFTGTDGDFLVVNPANFVVFLPKRDVTLTYSNIFFPTQETHTVLFPKRPQSIRITPGSIIMGLKREDVHNQVKVITLFLSVDQNGTLYHKMQSYFSKVLNYFNMMWIQKLRAVTADTVDDFGLVINRVDQILNVPMIVGNSPVLDQRSAAGGAAAATKTLIPAGAAVKQPTPQQFAQAVKAASAIAVARPATAADAAMHPMVQATPVGDGGDANKKHKSTHP